MSAITLLPIAEHAASGQTEAIDVSNFTVLRLDVAVTDYAQNPAFVPESKRSCRDQWRLSVTIWDSPIADFDGPWRKFKTLEFNPTKTSEHFILSAFDAYMRVSFGHDLWTMSVDGVNVESTLTYGVTGEGKPDAA